MMIVRSARHHESRQDISIAYFHTLFVEVLLFMFFVVELFGARLIVCDHVFFLFLWCDDFSHLAFFVLDCSSELVRRF